MVKTRMSNKSSDNVNQPSSSHPKQNGNIEVVKDPQIILPLAQELTQMIEDATEIKTYSDAN